MSLLGIPGSRSDALSARNSAETGPHTGVFTVSARANGGPPGPLRRVCAPLMCLGVSRLADCKPKHGSTGRRPITLKGALGARNEGPKRPRYLDIEGVFKNNHNIRYLEHKVYHRGDTASITGVIHPAVYTEAHAKMCL